MIAGEWGLRVLALVLGCFTLRALYMVNLWRKRRKKGWSDRQAICVPALLAQRLSIVTMASSKEKYVRRSISVHLIRHGESKNNQVYRDANRLYKGGQLDFDV